MKIKSQLTLATLIVAGMFATGCQQMQQTAGASQQTTGSSQQTTGSSQQTAEPTEVTTTTTTTTGGGDPNMHTHADAPACASKTHSHPGARPGHTHVYGCVAGQRRPMVPKVKAKGNYKGAVQMDAASKAAMQQYQQ